jgi:hypothetical protein
LNDFTESGFKNERRDEGARGDGGLSLALNRKEAYHEKRTDIFGNCYFFCIIFVKRDFAGPDR